MPQGMELASAYVEFEANYREFEKATKNATRSAKKAYQGLQKEIKNTRKQINKTAEAASNMSDAMSKAASAASASLGILPAMLKGIINLFKELMKLAYKALAFTIGTASKVAVSALKSVITVAGKLVKVIGKVGKTAVSALWKVPAAAYNAFRGLNKYLSKLRMELVFIQLDIRYIANQAKFMAAVTGGAIGASVAALTRFEEAFVQVRKVVDMTDQSLENVGDSLREMSTRMVKSAEELAEMAAVGGQLGITGVKNLSRFTEVMAKLSTATNVTGQQGAAQFARLMNIMGETQDTMENMGSSLVALGNNFAAFEDEILKLSFRISGAGKAVGLTTQEIFGLSAALAAVGVQADRGGTAVSRLLIEMSSAVATGSDRVSEFANVAGKSVEEFTKTVNQDPIEAVKNFILGLERLDKEGKNVFQTLEDVRVNQIRTRDALLRLVSAGELLNETVAESNEAWENANALDREAEQRKQTLWAQIQMLKDGVFELARMIGETFMPEMKDMVLYARAFVQVLSEMDKEQLQTIKNFLKFTSAITAAVAGFAMLIRVLATFLTGLTFIAQAITTLGPLLLILWGMSEALKYLSSTFDTEIIGPWEAFVKVANGLSSALKGLWDVLDKSEIGEEFKNLSNEITTEWDDFVQDVNELKQGKALEPGVFTIKVGADLIDFGAGSISSIRKSMDSIAQIIRKTAEKEGSFSKAFQAMTSDLRVIPEGLPRRMEQRIRDQASRSGDVAVTEAQAEYIRAFRDLAKSLSDAFSETFRLVFYSIPNIFSAAVEATASEFEEPAIKLANSLWGFFVSEWENLVENKFPGWSNEISGWADSLNQLADQVSESEIGKKAGKGFQSFLDNFDMSKGSEDMLVAGWDLAKSILRVFWEVFKQLGPMIQNAVEWKKIWNNVAQTLEDEIKDIKWREIAETFGEHLRDVIPAVLRGVLKGTWAEKILKKGAGTGSDTNQTESAAGSVGINLPSQQELYKESINEALGMENVSLSEQDKKDIALMTKLESRGEPLEGQAAVAELIMNRIESKEFPNTAEGVITQTEPSTQFTPLKEWKELRDSEQDLNTQLKAVEMALNENFIGDSLYFANLETLLKKNVDSEFLSPKFEKERKIGGHTFGNMSYTPSGKSKKSYPFDDIISPGVDYFNQLTSGASEEALKMSEIRSKEVTPADPFTEPIKAGKGIGRAFTDYLEVEMNRFMDKFIRPMTNQYGIMGKGKQSDFSTKDLSQMFVDPLEYQGLLTETSVLSKEVRERIKKVNDVIRKIAVDLGRIIWGSDNNRPIPERAKKTGENFAPGLQSGGIIPGFGGGDTQPALLERGEAIVPAEIVRKGRGAIANWFKSRGVAEKAAGDIGSYVPGTEGANKELAKNTDMTVEEIKEMKKGIGETKESILNFMNIFTDYSQDKVIKSINMGWSFLADVFEDASWLDKVEKWKNVLIETIRNLTGEAPIDDGVIRGKDTSGIGPLSGLSQHPGIGQRGARDARNDWQKLMDRGEKTWNFFQQGVKGLLSTFINAEESFYTTIGGAILETFNWMGKEWEFQLYDIKEFFAEAALETINVFKNIGSGFAEVVTGVAKSIPGAIIRNSEIASNVAGSMRQTLPEDQREGTTLIGGAGKALSQGPVQALIAAFSALIQSSKPFANIMKMVSKQFKTVANIIGLIITPLEPLIEMLTGMLNPILKALAAILRTVLVPVVKLLTSVLEPLVDVIEWTAQTIVDIWNGLMDALSWALDWLPKVNFEGLKVNMDQFNKDLDDLGDEADDVSESLNNVPEGFKIALRRFESTNPRERRRDSNREIPIDYSSGVATTQNNSNVNQGDIIVNLNGNYYGQQDFERAVVSAVESGKRKRNQAEIGVGTV